MVFNAGHRIRISVSGSNWPRFEVNPNDGADLSVGTDGQVARPRLLFGRGHGSRIELPIPPRPRHVVARQKPAAAIQKTTSPNASVEPDEETARDRWLRTTMIEALRHLNGR
jgi:hypothetical protein